MIRCVFVLIFVLFGHLVFCEKVNEEVVELVKYWSEEIGKALRKLSETMSRKSKAKESFNARLKNCTYRESGSILAEKIAAELRQLMDNRSHAAQKIAEYAEYLSFHRKNDSLFPNGTYHYFNADNFTNTKPTPQQDQDMEINLKATECKWWCHLRNLPTLEKNQVGSHIIDYIFRNKGKELDTGDCDCDVNVPSESEEYYFYKNMSLRYHPHFETEVNLNLSVIKTVWNVYDRDQEVLEGARWTEPLDLIFKENYEQDPTLTWQYFASSVGYMRHYPAVKWSDEDYDKTYDMRTRSWYTEAMTSPKDLIILVDRSGSTLAGRRRYLISQIVNNILDTLNDNDFVNVIIFNNSTDSLVPCFQDTLVQANEENLRLFREYLPVSPIRYAADILLGLKKGFQILERFRNNRKSSNCNQAIMLLTEQIDYDYKPEAIAKMNKDQNVRIFTYLLGKRGGDRDALLNIACNHKGYYVNVSLDTEIREKMLNYIKVMSRPINYAINNKQNPIWSYLYVDLADRRICNWLWKKIEGIRQREVFLDHVKRLYKRERKTLTSAKINVLEDSHPYAQYEIARKNHFMTTVSYPVYGRRNDETELIGVAGVDIPIKLLKSLIPHYKLGVNGYAFVVTNNGYVLMHPDHRPCFADDIILKPTFNRVDLLELEILDDLNEPRLFDESVVKLREKVVYKGQGTCFLKVKFPLDDLKRVVLSGRHYFYTDIGPFGFSIVLPDRYGLIKINDSKVSPPRHGNKGLLNSKYWKVHPDWTYCTNCGEGSPEDKIRNCLKDGSKCDQEPLFKALLVDADITRWFTEPIKGESLFIDKYYVNKVFIATRSGLTRWRTYKKNDDLDETNDFELTNMDTIDEHWYRRAVEENFDNENMFIYSVPFEISGYENNTMITATNAIFVNNGVSKTPVATIGIQFNHRTMSFLYTTITQKCKSEKCNITCESDYLSCFILDNNAYVVLSDEMEFTGRFIGDLRPDIMYHLVDQKVFLPTRMFDYQGICHNKPHEVSPETCSSFKFTSIFANFIQIFQWMFSTLINWFPTISADDIYHSKRPDTKAFENLKIDKSVPTPCDQEMWLFTLENKFSSSPIISNKNSKYVCAWPYVVNKIPGSNLLFLAINNLCKIDTVQVYTKSPTPFEIKYNDSLPCYIAIKNNYSRHIYTKCYQKDPRENDLNKNNKNCGHTWEGDYE